MEQHSMQQIADGLYGSTQTPPQYGNPSPQLRPGESPLDGYKRVKADADAAKLGQNTRPPENAPGRPNFNDRGQTAQQSREGQNEQQADTLKTPDGFDSGLVLPSSEEQDAWFEQIAEQFNSDEELKEASQDCRRFFSEFDQTGEITKLIDQAGMGNHPGLFRMINSINKELQYLRGRVYGKR